jgi:hypothetical protein
MPGKKWGNLIKALFRKHSGVETAGADEKVLLRLLPLSVGLRIDTTAPAGSGSGLGVSVCIWMSPVESPRQGGSLRIVNFPN